jgi:hypothetical protein
MQQSGGLLCLSYDIPHNVRGCSHEWTASCQTPACCQDVIPNALSTGHDTCIEGLDDLILTKDSIFYQMVFMLTWITPYMAEKFMCFS